MKNRSTEKSHKKDRQNKNNCYKLCLRAKTDGKLPDKLQKNRLAYSIIEIETDKNKSWKNYRRHSKSFENIQQ